MGKRSRKRTGVSATAEPEKHKWMRIGNEDIGEPGCKYWEVRPRLGVIGMLMNWWRVKISSGCPLAGPPG